MILAHAQRKHVAAKQPAVPTDGDWLEAPASCFTGHSRTRLVRGALPTRGAREIWSGGRFRNPTRERESGGIFRAPSTAS